MAESHFRCQESVLFLPSVYIVGCFLEILGRHKVLTLTIVLLQNICNKWIKQIKKKKRKKKSAVVRHLNQIRAALNQPTTR